jgi:hypothetical protein
VRSVATITHEDGRTLFRVTSNKTDIHSAINELKTKINAEFDFCVDADNWKQVLITIERK